MASLPTLINTASRDHVHTYFSFILLEDLFSCPSILWVISGRWVENALDFLFPYIYYQHNRGHLQEFNVIDW